MEHAARGSPASQQQLLLEMARRYVWWLEPEVATERPKRVLAQVMSRGDYQDVLLVLEQFGERQLREVIGSAEAGWFDDRSWHYWHYKLGLAEPGRVPPSPVRRFG